jgi:hypothetical protein
MKYVFVFFKAFVGFSLLALFVIGLVYLFSAFMMWEFPEITIDFKFWGFVRGVIALIFFASMALVIVCAD